MEVFIIILGIVLILAGMAGSFLPILPGPPLAFGGMVLIRIFTTAVFSLPTVWVFGITMLLITLSDYFLPGLLVKFGKGSKSGAQGANIGVIVGLFIGPIGLILGPYIGAMIGELSTGKTMGAALRPALFAFLGFVGGVFLKFAYALLVLIWVITAVLF